MKVIVSEEWLEEIKKNLTKDESEEFRSKYEWTARGSKVKVEIEELCEKSLEWLHGFLDGKGKVGDGSAKLSAGQVRQWMEICKNPDGQVVSKLENLDSAMKKYIEASEHRWLFEQTPDGNMVPWFVDEIKYNPQSQYCQKHVAVSLVAINSGKGAKRRGEEGSSFSIAPHDFRKRTVSQILREKGFHLESKERVKSYEKERIRYMEISQQDGYQMSVTGKCLPTDGWRSDGWRTVEKAGRPAKMVIDPDKEESGHTAIECHFWSDKPDDHLWSIPTHPVMAMFDLEEHDSYRVHVNNAVPYEYDVKVGDKLVLPKDVKDFIETLVEHSANKFVDIVGGKEGGTVIMLEGPPGTGKTLSAEVYSEVMRRPLYKVQSSQLGISANALEEQLKMVLQRAERWGAILLIDEADVYVRSRSDDIHQNAIVGVFLRVLEYYRGVLFMTTNRGTVVDDAIISRLTARFRYAKPSKEEQAELWRILARQNGVDISDSEIELVVDSNPNLSGRDIKNLLKLAYVAALKRGGKVTAGLISYVSRFKQSGDSKA